MQQLTKFNVEEVKEEAEMSEESEGDGEGERGGGERAQCV